MIELNSTHKEITSMVESKMRQNSMIVRAVSPTDSLWQELLEILPHDFYHLPGYLALEAARYNAIPEAIVIRSDEKIFFLSYLIRDCSDILSKSNHQFDRTYDVVSPYGYPGMLVSQAGQNPEFIRKCLNLIYNYWNEHNICSAFIRLHPILNSYISNSCIDDDKSVFCRQGDVVLCDLTKTFEEIGKQIRSSHRTKINRLIRAGFTVKIGSIDEHLNVFIDIYRETMDRVNATDDYYFTRAYFESLVRILGDKVKICIVEIDGEVVATSLITEFSGIVQYYLGGTKTAFLRQSPAIVMFKYIIEWAKQRNNKFLNFGGGLGGHRDSLYHFKAGFSDECASFATIKTIIDQERYDRLIAARASSLGVSRLELESTSFFPAYRSA
jgi:Acetyltransferase (GNAT) domain